MRHKWDQTTDRWNLATKLCNFNQTCQLKQPKLANKTHPMNMMAQTKNWRNPKKTIEHVWMSHNHFQGIVSTMDQSFGQLPHNWASRGRISVTMTCVPDTQTTRIVWQNVLSFSGEPRCLQSSQLLFRAMFEYFLAINPGEATNAIFLQEQLHAG